MSCLVIVIHLLIKRKSVTCPEDILLTDFSATDDPLKEFDRWCLRNRIRFKRVPERKIMFSID